MAATSSLAFHSSAKHARTACNIASVTASSEHIGLAFYLEELFTVLTAWPVHHAVEQPQKTGSPPAPASSNKAP